MPPYCALNSFLHKQYTKRIPLQVILSLKFYDNICSLSSAKLHIKRIDIEILLKEVFFNGVKYKIL